MMKKFQLKKLMNFWKHILRILKRRSKELKKSKMIIIDTIQKRKKHIKQKLIFKKVN